jgi:1-acyl-sn-glycerol-3-phosphate acyltransferase
MKKFLIRLFYYFTLWSWVTPLLLLVSSRDIQGRENVPRKGALIMVSNHMGNADPPVLTVTLPRQLAWLTKAEWFKTPVIGGMFRMGGCIPVRRQEADLGALRRCEDALRQGLVLGMFPEGTRSKGQGLQRGEPGSALLALRTGTPLLPVAIWGTEKVKLPRDLFFKRSRVHVRFGKPFTLPRSRRITKEDVIQGTDRLMREIAALLPAEFRGLYADEPAKVPAATSAQKE